MATIKKAQNGRLTKAEMDALSHQKRGMGAGSTFVKKAGPIKNETGNLTSAQRKQLDAYMSKAGTAKKVYEALPNVGRMLGHGNSAADIPKGSQLEKQRKGGSTPKAQDGVGVPKGKAKTEMGKLVDKKAFSKRQDSIAKAMDKQRASMGKPKAKSGKSVKMVVVKKKK